MKKIVLLSTMFILVAFLFNGCSKFEEGPGISLKSKKARLANTWSIEKIINQDTGDEMTVMEMFAGGEDTEDLGFDMELDLQLSFEKDGNMEMIMAYSIFGMSFESSAPGTWEFVGDTGLEVTIDMSGMDMEGETNTDATDPETMEYNILRLASNELWLEYAETVLDSTGTETDINYEIHLIPAE